MYMSIDKSVGFLGGEALEGVILTRCPSYLTLQRFYISAGAIAVAKSTSVLKCPVTTFYITTPLTMSSFFGVQCAFPPA